MNPHYNYDKLDWKQIEFEEPGLSYEFNYLCFWLTPKGLVFSARDSGCSCPSPFEDYEGETAVEIEQKLERVENFEHAKNIFDAWNKNYNDKPYLNPTDVASDMETLRSWFQ